MFSFNTNHTHRNFKFNGRLPEKQGGVVFVKCNNGYRYLVKNIGTNNDVNPMTDRLKRIKKDYDEAMRDLRDGKLKGYNSTAEMWADLEAEGYI
jgi:hypothetical protein